MTSFQFCTKPTGLQYGCDEVITQKKTFNGDLDDCPDFLPAEEKATTPAEAAGDSAPGPATSQPQKLPPASKP